MTIGNLRPGDVVRANVRGELFWAIVEEKAEGKVVVTTLCSKQTRILTARQIAAKWARRKR